MLNSNGIIIPGAPKPEPQKNPMQLASQIIRAVEAARHKSIEDLCAMLAALSFDGWPMMIDPAVPDGRCVITVANHISRDLQHGTVVENERVLRLGILFQPALNLLSGQSNPETPDQQSEKGETLIS